MGLFSVSLFGVSVSFEWKVVAPWRVMGSGGGAGIGLVDEVEECGSRLCLRRLELRRQHDLGLDVQVARPVALHSWHPLPREPEGSASLGAGGNRQQDAALQGRDRDLRAEQRLAQGQGELALEVRSPPRVDGMRRY